VLPNAISLGIGSWSWELGTWTWSLLDLAAWAQAAGDAGRMVRSMNRRSAPENAIRFAGLIVRISKLAQERVELSRLTCWLPDPAAASGYIVEKVQHLASD